jgi:class 3 adenylate cyclase
MLEHEVEDAERLLTLTFPDFILRLVKENRQAAISAYGSVLFADLVGSTKFASETTPLELTRVLDFMFNQFDLLAAQHGVVKIKTIGDCYVACTGIFVPASDHCPQLCAMACGMHQIMATLNDEYSLTLDIRVGIHSGEMIGGVVGKIKFGLDLWSHDVQIANLMEEHGIIGRTNLSATAHQLASTSPMFKVNMVGSQRHAVSAFEEREDPKGVYQLNGRAIQMYLINKRTQDEPRFGLPTEDGQGGEDGEDGEEEGAGGAEVQAADEMKQAAVALNEIEGSYMRAARRQEGLVQTQRDDPNVDTSHKAQAMLKLGELYGRYKAVLAGKVVKIEALKVYDAVLLMLREATEDYAEQYPNETAEALFGIACQHLYSPAKKGEEGLSKAEAAVIIKANLEQARDTYHKCGNFTKEALVLDTQGNFYSGDEAKQSMEEALMLREQQLEGAERDRDCAASFMSLAKLYRKGGDHRKALAYYEKAKAAYTSGFGEGHPKILPAYEGVVHELAQLKEHQRAREELHK